LYVWHTWTVAQFKDEKLIKRVSSKIQKIRLSQGITLEDFYFDTGIHLARIEQGKSNISISTLSQICKYFKISLQDFFEGL
jgi:transcriptional regulator with XRE-family HTH domain